MDKGDRTKARMVDVTAKLLRRQGYSATGLNQIVDESKAPKGSLYFHFRGGKDELVTAALRVSGDAWFAHLVGLLERQAPDVEHDIDVICEALARELRASQFSDGCPLATVTLETAARSEPLRAVCAERYRRWEAIVAARLGAAGVPAARTAELATLVLSSIEGALLLARAYHDTTPLQRVAATLKHAVLPRRSRPRTRR